MARSTTERSAHLSALSDKERAVVHDMLSYFWHAKGDIRHWSEYDAKKYLFPGVVEAIKDFGKARAAVTAAINRFGDGAHD